MIKVKFKGTKPERKTEGSAGYDLFSNDSLVIPPNSMRLVSTNTFIELPIGYEAQIRSRSGNAAKHSVFVLNSPGTIDSDYRGEIKAIIYNLGDSDFKISVGDRIAQMVISAMETADWELVDEFSDSERGSGGFGSTGK